MNDRDKAILESALHEITYVKRAEYPRGKNGEYIIATPDKLIYTDGNYETPTVDKIIEFNSVYETEIDEMRRLIYDAEKGKSEFEVALRTIEDAFGYGSANVVADTNYRANARPKRTGQGKNGRKINTSRSKASREREYNKRLKEASRKGLSEIQDVIENELKYSYAGEGAKNVDALNDAKYMLEVEKQSEVETIPSDMYKTDETNLDRVKWGIYDSKWRGIQPTTGELFRRYFAFDFKFQSNQQGTGTGSVGNRGDNRYRGRNGEETSSAEGRSNINYSFELIILK